VSLLQTQLCELCLLLRYQLTNPAAPRLSLA
jgi:hypothetical protein